MNDEFRRRRSAIGNRQSGGQASLHRGFLKRQDTALIEAANPASTARYWRDARDPRNLLRFRRSRTGANLSTPKKIYTAKEQRSQEEIPWQTKKTRARTRLVVARRSRMASIAAPNVKEQAIRLNSIVTADIRSVAETFKPAAEILGRKGVASRPFCFGL